MMARHARTGRVEAIYLRPERRAEVVSVERADLGLDGIDGDHGRAGKRAVTLIQAEHLAVIAALLDADRIDAARLRRNLVVSGLNLLAVRNHVVSIGEARLRITGPCPPCSRMEEALGPGGYSAVRGHGGVYAEVVAAGPIRTGSPVERVGV